MKTNSFLCPAELILCCGGPCSPVRPSGTRSLGLLSITVCVSLARLSLGFPIQLGMSSPKPHLDSCHKHNGDVDLSHPQEMCLRISLNCQERPILFTVVGAELLFCNWKRVQSPLRFRMSAGSDFFLMYPESLQGVFTHALTCILTKPSHTGHAEPTVQMRKPRT